ncbi:MAG TPA: hypothetical protein VF765_07175 [Polyangiaceae bacterium]
MKAPLAGGAPTTLASDQNQPFGIAVDESYVYWTEFGSRHVMKVPIAGGTPVTIASNRLNPAGIAVDATSVYWTNFGEGTVMRLTPK